MIVENFAANPEVGISYTNEWRSQYFGGDGTEAENKSA